MARKKRRKRLVKDGGSEVVAGGKGMQRRGRLSVRVAPVTVASGHDAVTAFLPFVSATTVPSLVMRTTPSTDRAVLPSPGGRVYGTIVAHLPICGGILKVTDWQRHPW